MNVPHRNVEQYFNFILIRLIFIDIYLGNENES